MASDFEYKGTKISFSEQGEGNALVFIHGFLEEKSMWDDLIDNFKSNYHCVSVDLLGHGKSENHGYIHTMKEQAEMILALLFKLNLKKYTLIGHSMGGYVALELSKLNPSGIKGLVLQNSTSYPDTVEKIANRNRGIAAVKENARLFIQVAVPMLFSEKNRTVFSKEVKEVTSKALGTSTQGIIAALEGMKVREDNSNILKESHFPILMIIGKEDPALDYNSLIQQTENTDVVVEIFEDGHMSHIENYSDLQATYTSFFKDCN